MQLMIPNSLNREGEGQAESLSGCRDILTVENGVGI